MNFLDNILQNDRFAIVNGVELVEVNERYAIAKAPIRPDSLNADGVAQGGFVYTLADLCFTYLSNYLHPRTVTKGGSISYMAPAKGDVLYAKAVELGRSKHNNVVQVTVYTDTGTIAVCQFDGFIQPLDH